MPAHEATFYPRGLYSVKTYDTSRIIYMDGDVTRRGATFCVAIFVPVVVCEFKLGERSTAYGNPTTVLTRAREGRSPRSAVEVVPKRSRGER